MSEAGAAGQSPNPDPIAHDDAALAERLAAVDARIEAAAHRAGREPASITRIVVTKFHPVSLVSALARLAVRDVGENRPQELADKVRTSDAPGMRWHAIGQVQTNKANQLARVAASVPLVIHTIDRERLVDALDRSLAEHAPGRTVDALVQLNLTDDAARGGASEAQIVPLARRVAESGSLRLRGIMAVAPLDEDPAHAFARLAHAADLVRQIDADASWVSAGMSGDLEQAVAAGATHLRIGTAITGNRPPRG